jgi:mediator of RNA polymerase II transcription subunit 7
MMMEEQLSRTREEIREMDKLKEELTAVLDQLAAEGADVGSTIPPATGDDKKAVKPEEHVSEDSQLVWDIIDELDR